MLDPLSKCDTKLNTDARSNINYNDSCKIHSPYSKIEKNFDIDETSYENIATKENQNKESYSDTDADDEKTESYSHSFAQNESNNPIKETYAGEQFKSSGSFAFKLNTNFENKSPESDNDSLLNLVSELSIQHKSRLQYIENAFNEVSMAQHHLHKMKLDSMRAQLKLLKKELNELQNDHSILFQWVKVLFSELERATNSGELSAQLKVTSNNIARLLEKPIDRGKMLIIYRSFVETLTYKK